MPEPILPPPEPLLSQFAARPVFIVGEVDDERLSSTYWLAPPPVDEADQDMDQVNLAEYMNCKGTLIIQQTFKVTEFVVLYFLVLIGIVLNLK